MTVPDGYQVTNGQVILHPGTGWTIQGDVDSMLKRFDAKITYVVIPTDYTTGSPVNHVALSPRQNGDYDHAVLSFQWYGGQFDMTNALLTEHIPNNISNSAAAVMMLIARHPHHLLTNSGTGLLIASHRTHGFDALVEIIANARPYTSNEYTQTSLTAITDGTIWLKQWLTAYRLPELALDRCTRLEMMAQSLWDLPTIREWYATFINNLEAQPDHEHTIRQGLNNLETLATAWHLIRATDPNRTRIAGHDYSGRAAFIHRNAMTLLTGPDDLPPADLDWLTWADAEPSPADEIHYYTPNLDNLLPPHIFPAMPPLPPLTHGEKALAASMPHYTRPDRRTFPLPFNFATSLGIQSLRLASTGFTLYFSAVHSHAHLTFSTGYWMPYPKNTFSQPVDTLSLVFPPIQRRILRLLFTFLWIRWDNEVEGSDYIREILSGIFSEAGDKNQ